MLPQSLHHVFVNSRANKEVFRNLSVATFLEVVFTIGFLDRVSVPVFMREEIALISAYPDPSVTFAYV